MKAILFAIALVAASAIPATAAPYWCGYLTYGRYAGQYACTFTSNYHPSLTVFPNSVRNAGGTNLSFQYINQETRGSVHKHTATVDCQYPYHWHDVPNRTRIMPIDSDADLNMINFICHEANPATNDVF